MQLPKTVILNIYQNSLNNHFAAFFAAQKCFFLIFIWCVFCDSDWNMWLSETEWVQQPMHLSGTEFVASSRCYICAQFITLSLSFYLYHINSIHLRVINITLEEIPFVYLAMNFFSPLLSNTKAWWKAASPVIFCITSPSRLLGCLKSITLSSSTDTILPKGIQQRDNFR